MRNVSIALAAMVTCVALAAAPSGAQSRTTNTLKKSVRQTESAGSPYRFMDTAEFPQEWHGRQSPDSEEDTAAAQPRTGSSKATGQGDETSARTRRSQARAEWVTVQGSAAHRSTPALRRSATRTTLSSDANVEPPSRPRPARSIAKTTPGQRQLANRLLPASRPAAHQQLSASESRPTRSPYAFMDTVGFPETYREPGVRSAEPTARRSTAAPTRRTRSRSTLPPGYVEVK